MTRWLHRLPALVGILLALPAPAQDAAAGAALYSRFCATCHGVEGRGDGPTAAVISVPPVDLGGLAAANGGVFPVARVLRRIDGRDEVLAHGSPMPIYGAFFEAGRKVPVPTDEGEMFVTLPVLAIVRYLETLQR
ncbi:c-type cytochrome [Tropicimonas sp. IMCC34043]|uniref:c-type cytochrome n=1 Tax=Tropicimonas sp. IMCC34043 TaxID=2248760 RepID=UPI001E5F1E1D|nr:c-type cytochrome [Tropicimonas sp. IMCC34043]